MKKQTQKKKANPDLWDSQWQKRPFKWTRIHTYFALFALAGVVLVAVIWWRLFSAGPANPQELQNDFYTYVFELMEEYKPRYILYDRLADPKGLLQEDGWQTVTAADEQSAARMLLGEGCRVQSWENLKQAEADRLWRIWYYGDKEMRMDVFVITELSLHIDNGTLPALQENTWLVINGQGDQYILVRAGDTWGIRLLAAIR